jgi:GT2 family glycosyltransferase
MKAEITLSIVTYNSEAVIANCLASIPPDLPVTVVDNASEDASCDIISGQFPHVRLIRSEKNLGFGRAHNLALRDVTTPYALILNPDAALRPHAIERLIEAATTYPEAAILAPALLDEQEKPQNNSYNRTIFERGKGNRMPLPEGPICADFLSGAALLVRTARFHEIGGFDENIFLFYEDDDLCLQARRHGYSCIYVPNAHIYHVAGRSSPTKSWPQIKQKYWHMAQSELQFYQKYLGESAARRQASLNIAIAALKTLAYTLTFKRFKRQKYYARLLGALRFCGNKR